MKKQKVQYICSSCGYKSLRWLGKCPECDSWNSFVEEVVEKELPKHASAPKSTQPYKLKNIEASSSNRTKTGISEFDRVLGGGLMPGSITLLGGDPGIGKSTLVLQVAANLTSKVLYVSGEESGEQIKLRANRLHVKSEELLFLPETELHTILSVIKQESPSLVIIDSIQTIYDSNLENSPGSLTQLRETTSMLMEETKKHGFATIIIGHITKEGTLAGPKILEHIVDTVIMFEGDTSHAFRILRAQKNRFGSTNEIGVFEMHDSGLREVTNPSELFIGERKTNISGSVISASVEGTRPLLIEVQALVTPSHFGNPQRVSNGIDYRRLSILLAVIEKRNSNRLSAANVFLNITGGVRIEEPAIDLPVCCAIISNLLDKPIDPSMIIIGEVGLGGEIRSVSFPEKRVQEAEKMGFRKIIMPAQSVKALNYKGSMKLIGVEYLNEAADLCLL